MSWLFGFFFLSGLCSIVYQLVWLRLAMADLGVTSAVTSMVLSTFMAGLGLGSWIAGALLRRFGSRISAPLVLYALLELIIAAGGVAVPYLMSVGRARFEGLSLSSQGYYVAAGFWLACTLLPWCAAMGATIPTGMLVIRRAWPQTASRSFSFLYLANVLGAVAGTVVPLFLNELYGFRASLRFAVALNLTIAVLALVKSRQITGAPGPEDVAAQPAAPQALRPLVLLFIGGLVSMALEIAWIRQFTPYLGTVVYAFAAILALYLLSTYVGSQVYRRCRLPRTVEVEAYAWPLVSLTVLLSLPAADPTLAIPRLVRPLIAIVPFSALLGFMTPMLVERWSGSDASRAGRAYAINVVGCIAGPLIAGFVLLPRLSEQWMIVLLALPWLFVTRWRALSVAVAAAGVALVSTSHGYEALFPSPVVLRDHTATSIATGEGLGKRLLVNGAGMTGLSVVTKTMAHLPLAFLDRPAQSALVICFGMGTTHRSFLSWGISSTAVELVPSVPKLFGFFHADAAVLMASTRSHIVVDDGRRFLARTGERFDVITVDPPPPVEAAGSSLLASLEFFQLIAKRLRDGGIVHYWLFGDDAVTRAAVVQALQSSFRHVRAFPLEGKGNVHLLASDRPLPERSAAELAARLPPAAVADFLEWNRGSSVEEQFAALLANEVRPVELTTDAPQVGAMRDDRPVNEFYVLRRLAAGSGVRSVIPRP